MADWGVGIAVGLNENKAGGILGMLETLEPGDARFLDALARVGEGGLLKGIHGLGFDMNMDMNDEHKNQFSKKYE
jgi:hypothetical protein